MYKHFTFDTSIQVGDLVASSYHKPNIIFRVVNIERRFISQNEIDRLPWAYEGCAANDEKNPVVEITPVLDLDSISNKKIKIRTKYLDGAYIKKISKEKFLKNIEEAKEEFITKLKYWEDTVKVLFP